MTRKLIWGVLAFAPAIVMSLAFVVISQDINYAPPLAIEGSMWGDYWWAILGGISFLITLLFMASALFNKNIETGEKSRVLFVTPGEGTMHESR